MSYSFPNILQIYIPLKYRPEKKKKTNNFGVFDILMLRNQKCKRFISTTSRWISSPVLELMHNEEYFILNVKLIM